MRKILFRGKVKGSDKNPDGLWVYGFPYQENDEWFILYDFAGAFGNGRMQKNEVIKETVGQFTGLTDKNGKEIFEGDVFSDSLGYNAIVEWDEKNARYLGLTTKNRAIMYIGREPQVTVIGNIHDNPKLLNQ